MVIHSNLGEQLGVGSVPAGPVGLGATRVEEEEEEEEEEEKLALFMKKIINFQQMDKI